MIVIYERCRFILVVIKCVFMTEAAWRSLYVSFAYKHASRICTSLSRPKAVHISGVHCILKYNLSLIFAVFKIRNSVCFGIG